MNDIISETAKNTVLRLIEKGLTVSSAESCTGGMLSAYITSVAGASAVFELGIASYSSRIKNSVVGVDGDTLESFGAISSQTAVEMAEKVRAIAGADLGVSITGSAGPDPSENKAPGTVFIAIADKNSSKWVLLETGNIGRNAVREKACLTALELISNYTAAFKP